MTAGPLCSAVVTVRIVKTGNLHGNDTLSGLREQFSSSTEALLQHCLRERERESEKEREIGTRMSCLDDNYQFTGTTLR